MVAKIRTHTCEKRTRAREKLQIVEVGYLLTFAIGKGNHFLYIKRRYNSHCTFAPALILSDNSIMTKSEVQSAHTLRFPFSCMILCAWGAPKGE